MENPVEKWLEKYPVSTIIVLSVLAVSIALGLGIVTWLANKTVVVKSKFGTAPATAAGAPAPTK